MPIATDRSLDGRTPEIDAVTTTAVLSTAVKYDRIRAKRPTHDLEAWQVGTIERVDDRDGHCAVDVSTPDGQRVTLTVSPELRDLFVRRLDLEPGETPVGERVWYRRRT